MMETTRSEWLKERRRGLGATDIATIIVSAADKPDRVGSWVGSPFKVWSEKMNLNIVKEETTQIMRRGQMMEPYVCALYQEHLGGDAALDDTGLIWHPERKKVFGTPDRMVLHNGAKFGMDAKTRRSSRGWGTEDGAIPLDVEIQMRVYMEVTDSPYWDIAVLFGLDDFRVYRIDRDETLGSKILDTAERWWSRYVAGNRPPDADATTAAKEVLSLIHPRVKNVELREPTAEEIDIHKELTDVKEQHKELSQRKLGLENRLRQLIGDDVGISGVATWKQNKDSLKFDQKKFENDHPDLYSEYLLKRPGSRVLRIIGEKK